MRIKNPNLPNKKKIWEFIGAFYKEHGFSPTFQEIADYMKFSAKQQVSYYTDQLKKDKKIKIYPRKRRGIKILAP